VDGALIRPGRWLVLQPPNELGLETAAELRAALDGAIARSRLVLVDMSEVAFINSSGVGVLIGAQYRLAAQGGLLRLAHCSEFVARVLRVAGWPTSSVRSASQPPCPPEAASGRLKPPCPPSPLPGLIPRRGQPR
jgi:anti-sigma B factor antagonist